MTPPVTCWKRLPNVIITVNYFTAYWAERVIAIVVVAVNDGGGHNVSRRYCGGRCHDVVRCRRWAAVATTGSGWLVAGPRHHVRVPTARVHGHCLRVVHVLRRARFAPDHLPWRQAYNAPRLRRRPSVRTCGRSRFWLCRPRRWSSVTDMRRQSPTISTQEDQIRSATITAVMTNAELVGLHCAGSLSRQRGLATCTISCNHINIFVVATLR